MFQEIWYALANAVIMALIAKIRSKLLIVSLNKLPIVIKKKRNAHKSSFSTPPHPNPKKNQKKTKHISV